MELSSSVGYKNNKEQMKHYIAVVLWRKSIETFEVQDFFFFGSINLLVIAG